MTDTDTTTDSSIDAEAATVDDAEAGDEDAGRENDAEAGDEDDGGRNVRRYANYAILLVLGLLAFVAVVRLYLTVSDVIATWVTDEYRSLFQAAFNLVVLLLTGVGISIQLRRLYR
jgi:uncharacterized membrane protein